MGAIGNLFKALLGRCDTNPLSEGLWELSGDTVVIQLESVGQLGEMGGAVFLQGKGLTTPILVINSGPRGFRAYENRCTHGGRKLDPRDGGETIRCCSLGHSTYDQDGNNLTGPAKGPIKVFPVEQKNGRLIIDLGH